MMSLEHLINETDFGKVTVCKNGKTYLLRFQNLVFRLGPVEIAYFKDFIFTKKHTFCWFKTMLDVKALVHMEQLNLQFVLTEKELEQLGQLLMETQLIIESRLLTLPSQRHEKTNKRGGK
ncbi:MAG: hypothetical protein ACJAXX_002925 [Roseivirga sp.]|jgi:hypothetical protein